MYQLGVSEETINVTTILKIGQLDRTDPLYNPGPGQYTPGLTTRKTNPQWK
jgi:hypothetical protein